MKGKIKMKINANIKTKKTQIKNYFYILAIQSLLVTGCSTIGGTWDENELKASVSYETKCPIQNISISSFKDDGMAGTGKFDILACGKNYKYLRFGKSYFEESKSPLIK